MNERQRRFADEYILSGNIEQSALKAGYSKNYARGRSHELLANVGIKKYIDERMKEIDSNKIADQEEIMEYYTSVMRGEVTEEVPVPTKKGIQIVEVKAGIKDRNKAAEMLGKRYVMWTDKQELSGNVGVTIVDSLGVGEFGED